MPALKYGNVKNVETDFKQAPIGVYRLKAEEVNGKTKEGKGEMVGVRFMPTHDGEGKKLKETYSSIFYHAPLELENWGDSPIHPSWLRRLKELVVAFGLKETGGDLSKIEGKSCLARLVKDEDDDGEYRPKIGKLMSMKAQVADEDEEDEESEDEEGEEEDEAVDIDAMDRDELKAFIKEQELGIRVMSKYSDDEIREKINEALGDDEEEEEEEEEEEDEEGVDLDELSRAELKAFIKEQELEVKVLKNDSDDQLREKIQEALGSDDEEEEEEEEEEDEGDNYDEMSLAELREELENRELETKGKKNILVARLRKDDATDPV